MDYLAAQSSYRITGGTAVFRKCLKGEHYQRSFPLNDFSLAYYRLNERFQKRTNQEKKSSNGMHHKLKTSLNLIAFHQTPLFDPKKKNTWYTPADGRSYQKCQRRNFQQYLLKFADPNGSDSNVSQTTATGNL